MKTHLNLATRDLRASIAFYRTLLDAEPAKQYGDYALFLTEDPGLELALSLNPRAQASPDVHYGVVVDSAASVESAIERLTRAGLAVDIESGTCCYAMQNKVWATDPDGRRWETYFVVAESEARQDEDMRCCQEAGDEDAACCPAQP